MRRMACMVAALVTLAGTGPKPARAQTINLCKIYCATIYLACQSTFGEVDGTMCAEWIAGCYDGCAVNQ